MSKTFTVEGDITAADTRTLLTTQGSVTAPSSVVPSGITKISQIVVAMASEGLANGACSYILRLGGAAIKNGEQVLTTSASGRIAPQAGSDSGPQMLPAVVFDNIDIEVVASDTVTVAVEACGDDTGTARAAVTLVYA